jgi:hypothetical protein
MSAGINIFFRIFRREIQRMDYPETEAEIVLIKD